MVWPLVTATSMCATRLGADTLFRGGKGERVRRIKSDHESVAMSVGQGYLVNGKRICDMAVASGYNSPGHRRLPQPGRRGNFQDCIVGPYEKHPVIHSVWHDRSRQTYPIGTACVCGAS